MFAQVIWKWYVSQFDDPHRLSHICFIFTLRIEPWTQSKTRKFTRHIQSNDLQEKKIEQFIFRFYDPVSRMWQISWWSFKSSLSRCTHSAYFLLDWVQILLYCYIDGLHIEWFQWQCVFKKDFQCVYSVLAHNFTLIRLFMKTVKQLFPLWQHLALPLHIPFWWPWWLIFRATKFRGGGLFLFWHWIDWILFTPLPHCVCRCVFNLCVTRES